MEGAGEDDCAGGGGGDDGQDVGGEHCFHFFGDAGDGEDAGCFQERLFLPKFFESFDMLLLPGVEIRSPSASEREDPRLAEHGRFCCAISASYRSATGWLKSSVNSSSGADFVFDHRCAAGDHCLDFVGLRHFAAEFSEEGFHAMQPFLVEFEWLFQHGGEGLAGEIVFGGADAAGDDQEITIAGGGLYGFFDRKLIIRYGLVRENIATDGGELLA